MKRLNAKILWVLSVLLLSVVGTVTAQMPGTGDGPSVPAVVSKMESMPWYTPSEPVNLKFTLENQTGETLWVLRWQLPSDDIDANILEIRRDGQPAAYLGPLVKRAEPLAEDYVQIQPGDVYTVTFDPTAVYDMSAQGNYTVRYRVKMLDVRTDAPGESAAEPPDTRVIVAESHTTRLWFEGLPERPFVPFTGGESTMGIGGYTKCTTSQQSTLAGAHSAAVSITTSAKSTLANNALYAWWFGAYDTARFNTVKTHYDSIYSAFTTKSVTYDCSCKKRYYAYVYPSSPYKIYVCSVFWTAPLLGQDCKAGTLVHEMSHFTVTCGTDDYVYGATGAHSLALSNPTQAIDNADNHEYFAEQAAKAW